MRWLPRGIFRRAPRLFEMTRQNAKVRKEICSVKVNLEKMQRMRYLRLSRPEAMDPSLILAVDVPEVRLDGNPGRTY
jgi:hypothetical protein